VLRPSAIAGSLLTTGPTQKSQPRPGRFWIHEIGVMCEARACAHEASVRTQAANQAPSTGHTRASTKAGVSALLTSDVVFARCAFAGKVSYERVGQLAPADGGPLLCSPRWSSPAALCHATHRARPRLLQPGAAVGSAHYRTRGEESPAAVAAAVAKAQRQEGGSDCCSVPVHRRAGVTAGAC